MHGHSISTERLDADDGADEVHATVVVSTCTPRDRGANGLSEYFNLHQRHWLRVRQETVVVASLIVATVIAACVVEAVTLVTDAIATW